MQEKRIRSKNTLSLTEKDRLKDLKISHKMVSKYSMVTPLKCKQLQIWQPMEQKICYAENMKTLSSSINKMWGIQQLRKIYQPDIRLPKYININIKILIQISFEDYSKSNLTWFISLNHSPRVKAHLNLTRHKKLLDH